MAAAATCPIFTHPLDFESRTINYCDRYKCPADKQSDDIFVQANFWQMCLWKKESCPVTHMGFSCTFFHKIFHKMQQLQGGIADHTFNSQKMSPYLKVMGDAWSAYFVYFEKINKQNNK